MKRGTILLVLVSLAVAGAAAPAHGAVSCRPINATAVGQDLGGGQVTAQVIGGGLLHGTYEASFTITGFSGTVASFEGEIVFTVAGGTVTAQVTGTLDVTNGQFQATSTSITGTGRLAGATGSLTFSGVENLATGSFTETITGVICVDLSP
jgi:hypothetical protein